MYDPNLQIACTTIAIRSTRWPEFSRAIDYDDEQFRRSVLPSYDQMLKTFPWAFSNLRWKRSLLLINPASA
jgi:hypothetical protein